MKKSALFLSVLLLVSLAACGKKDESSSVVSSVSASSSSSAPSSSAVSDEAASAPASQPAGSEVAASGSSVEQAAEVSNFAGGKFIAFDIARYPDDRAPMLLLTDKGGFVLHFNAGDGRLGVMTGTYEATASGLQMEVLFTELDDFLGQDITSFSFSFDGNNILVYQGPPLGMTRSGDNFVREGIAPGSPEAELTGGSGSGGVNMYILGPGKKVPGGIPGGMPAPAPAAEATAAPGSESGAVALASAPASSAAAPASAPASAAG